MPGSVLSILHMHLTSSPPMTKNRIMELDFLTVDLKPLEKVTSLSGNLGNRIIKGTKNAGNNENRQAAPKGIFDTRVDPTTRRNDS